MGKRGERTVAAERIRAWIDDLHNRTQSVVLRTRCPRVEASEASQANNTRRVIVEATVGEFTACTLHERLARIAEQRIRRSHMAKAASEAMTKERDDTREAV